MSFVPTTKTGTNVASIVKRQFGDEAGVQITDSDILDWINDAQRKICNKNKVIKAKATSDVIGGQSDYSLPSLDINQIDGIAINGKFLRATEFPTAESSIIPADPQKTVSGTPEYWYEYAGVITLWPVPDSTISGGLSVYYTKNPTPLASLSDLLALPDKYFSQITELVLASAYELDENFQAAAYKATQARDGLDEINAEESVSQYMTYPTITVYEDC